MPIIQIEIQSISTEKSQEFLHAEIDKFVDHLNWRGFKVISYTKPPARKE